MPHIIAVIWDFDKTLIDGYMQNPIFEEYGVCGADFWKEVAQLPDMYMQKQSIKVHPETIYLNHFVNKTKDGTFFGLNNAKLKDFGKKLQFYPGIPAVFEKSKKLIESNPKYNEYGIKVEHYVVSTGFAQVIKGCPIMDYVECVWGCEFIEEECEEGQRRISEVGYAIDNIAKVRVLFEINKGVNVHKEIDVNSKLAKEKRRVPFENMIYIADGPSDVPAFSVVKKHGGETFAVFPRNNRKAFTQAEQMRIDGRISMYAEADYSEGTTAYLWIMEKIYTIAERISAIEKATLTSAVSAAPKHLT